MAALELLRLFFLALFLGLGAGAISSLRAWRAQAKRSFSDKNFEQFVFLALLCVIGLAVMYEAFGGTYRSDPI